MKTKNFTLMIASVLALVILTSFASAEITLGTMPTLSKTVGTHTFSFTATTPENELITFTAPQISFSGKTIDFTLVSENFNGTTKTITMTYVIPSGFIFELGEDYSTTLTASGNVSVEDSTKTISFQPDYCEYGEQGSWINLDLDDDTSGLDNDFEWRPLDNVELTLNIDNRRDDDIEGVIEYGLYDINENDWIFEEEMDFDVDEDEDQDFTIEFQIDPSDLNEDAGDSDYIFYVKVYDDEDGSEEEQCQQITENVKIIRNKGEVMLDTDDVVIPSDLSCGSEVTISAKVYNIGTDEQEDVYLLINNHELGIVNQRYEIGDLDSGDSEDVQITLTIPEDAEEKSYSLSIAIYDEDDDIYEIEDHEGDKEDAKYFFTLNLASGSCKVIPKATISANLVSGGKAGQELVVKAIVTSASDSTSVFTLSATGYDSWATVDNINPLTVSLAKGESKEVVYTLKVNKNIEGAQTFNIVATSEGSEIKQPVLVTIEKSGFSFLTGSIIGGDNWYLWAIGALNVILVIIIIFVALRIAKS